MVKSTLETIEHFLMSGATGALTVDVKPMTDITIKVSGIVIAKNGLPQHCIVPSVGYSRD